MVNNQILENLKDAIIELDLRKAKELCKNALNQNIDPVLIIENSIAQALKKVGEKYEAKEYFIPELIMAGETSTQLMEILIPHLSISKTSKAIGKVVIGTAKGDIHDIGKNIVVNFLKADGFEVIDLGVDVSSDQFINAIKEENPDIIAISGLISATLIEVEKIVKDITDANLKEKVKIIIGGAPFTEEFVKSIGADGHAKTAIEGVKICKGWMTK
ncbi:MAG: cobalamin B12-binding domain-containing protein [Promethearchaeota archaeon]